MFIVSYSSGGGGAMSLPVLQLMEVILDVQELWGMVAPADGLTIDAKKSKMARALLLGALSEDVMM